MPWDAVLVSAPDINAAAGNEVTVPVRFDNLAGEPVTSFQFSVEFDPAVIQPAEFAAGLAGTLGDGLNLAYHSPDRGVLNVVVYGAYPAAGDGEYITLHFTVTGKEGSSTPVTVRDIRLNDGGMPATAGNGSVTIQKR
jgi:hypothetical protein